jgi:hypothetical protein
VDRQEELDGEILGSLYFEAVGIRISVRFAGEHWSWDRRITLAKLKYETSVLGSSPCTTRVFWEKSLLVQKILDRKSMILKF